MARSTSGESVIQRVVRILEQFGPQASELTLTVLARRADLPIATTHRLVEELVYYGLLQRTDSRTVRIGNRLAEMCREALPHTTLREVAEPYLQDLHAVVGHDLLLGVLDGADVVYLNHLGERTKAASRLGRRVPAYATPCGLVLLAHLPRPQRDKILRGPLETVSDRTITEPNRLRRLLAEARRTGYAIAPAYADPDGRGIAAPIRDDRRQVIGALSITLPMAHRAQRLIPALLTTVRGISRQMGMPIVHDDIGGMPSAREYRLASME